MKEVVVDKADQLVLLIYQQLPAQDLLLLLPEDQSLPHHRAPRRSESRPELMIRIEMVMIEKGDQTEEKVDQKDFEWKRERVDMLDHQAP